MGYFGNKKEALKKTAHKAIGTEHIVRIKDDLVENFQALRQTNQTDEATYGMDFDQAVNHFGLSQPQLDEKYKSLAYQFYFNLLLFLGVVSYALFFFFVKKNLFDGIITLFVSIIPLSFMYSRAVQSSRIKHKKFMTVQEWRETGDFFPDWPFQSSNSSPKRAKVKKR